MTKIEESLANESDLTTLNAVREWIGEALPLIEPTAVATPEGEEWINWGALECAADILLSQATTLRRLVAEKRRAAVEGLTCLNCNGTERPCCDAPRFDPDAVACLACAGHGCNECE
jgi:hypothetical protein